MLKDLKALEDALITNIMRDYSDAPEAWWKALLALQRVQILYVFRALRCAEVTRMFLKHESAKDMAQATKTSLMFWL